MLSPMLSNQDSQFQCSRNRILNQATRNHLISTSEVTCLIDPLSIGKLLKEGNLAITIPFFFFFFLVPCMTSFFLLLLAIKVFQFVQLHEAYFHLLDWLLLDSN